MDSVDKALDEGKNIILEIEVQGALQVKEKMPEAIMIFIMPPNYETLLARIRGRGTETEEVIQKRMKQSHFEIENFHKYDYVVVNQTNGIEKAAENILDIMKVETLRTSRNLELAENFYN
jgi:guanylate kinase